MIHKYKYISVCIIIFLAGMISAYGAPGEESSEKKITINLTGISKKDSIKYYNPLYPVPGFSFNKNFMEGDSLPPHAEMTLNILEQHTVIDNKKYLNVNAGAYDIRNNSYLIEFDISKGYGLGARRKAVSGFISELFYSSLEDDIGPVFADKIIDSAEIRELRPIYVEHNRVARHEGYEFQYVMQRSSTYRAVRTTLQIGLGQGVGIAHYFYFDHLNKVDWVYEYTWDDAKSKILDGWYWDPNSFNTNTIYHLYAGLTYYQIARSHEYTIFQSFLWSLGGSTFWEYIGEWREQVSTNDMILTPTLGAVAGEAFMQTAFYFERTMKPGFFRELVYFIFYPAGWINRKLDSMNNGDIKVRLYFQSPVQMMIEDKMMDGIR